MLQVTSHVDLGNLGSQILIFRFSFLIPMLLLAFGNACVNNTSTISEYCLRRVLLVEILLPESSEVFLLPQFVNLLDLSRS
jgi:hypothetical protein